jgi:DNA-binding NtrC family response regulator
MTACLNDCYPERVWRENILIVDDEPTILFALSHVLESKEVNVVTAECFEQAKTALLDRSFDLVIADVRMSGMNGREGLELLSYIKGLNPQTLVIIMTAFGSDEIREDAYRRGASHYYEKPVDLNQLISRIRTLGISLPPSSGAGS